jgi:hypothetical protein
MSGGRENAVSPKHSVCSGALYLHARRVAPSLCFGRSKFPASPQWSPRVRLPFPLSPTEADHGPWQTGGGREWGMVGMVACGRAPVAKAFHMQTPVQQSLVGNGLDICDASRYMSCHSAASCCPAVSVLVLLSSDSLQTVLPFFDTLTFESLHSFINKCLACPRYSLSLTFIHFASSSSTGTSPTRRVLARLGSYAQLLIAVDPDTGLRRTFIACALM